MDAAIEKSLNKFGNKQKEYRMEYDMINEDVGTVKFDYPID